MAAGARSLGERAIVLGAGIAGTLVARVLADHFDQVLVLERDSGPDQNGFRKGVPQARFVHGVLRGGLDAMNTIFPGLEQDLYAHGAVRAKPARDSLFVDPIGVWPRSDVGFELPFMTRALLEGRLRHALAATAHVRLEEQAAVAQLIGDGERIRGVRYRSADGGTRDIGGDLIVDATGRTAHASQWLAPLGYPAPEETRVEVDISYAACFIRPARPPGLLSALVVEPAPKGRYGCLIQAQEGDRMIAGLACRGRDAIVPEDFAGILARAEQLPHPGTFEILRDAEPLSPVLRFGFPASIQRHYERLTHVPAGFLCIGDAICSFNPVWGQGMSVAALEVLALGRLLEQCALDEASLSGLEKNFYQRAAQLIAPAWQLSVNPDFSFETTRGERPASLKEGRGFMRALATLAQSEPEVQALINDVFHLVKPLEAFRSPELLAKVLPLLKAVPS